LLEIKREKADLKFKLDGYVSNANYNMKKATFILFINHRLVDSTPIKRAVDAVYANYLPKHTHPFIFLSLEMAPADIDVNVHPTKREVEFLNEEQILEEITQGLESVLAGANNSRVFYTQAVLPHAPSSSASSSSSVSPSVVAKSKNSSAETDDSKNKSDSKNKEEKTDKKGKRKNNDAPTNGKKKPPRREESLVRTNKSDGKLDAFMTTSAAGITEKKTTPKKKVTSEVDGKAKGSLAPAVHKKVQTVRLTSVRNLLQDIFTEGHKGLQEVFQNHTWVGCVDTTWALIQHQTKLYLLNVPTISKAFMYERVFKGFSNHPKMSLSSSPRLKDLLLIALDSPQGGWRPEEGDKATYAETLEAALVAKGPMLNEYFSIEISPEGLLVALPMLIEGYVPPLALLPLFILRLAVESNWETEQACFQSIAQELSVFLYAQPRCYFLSSF